MPKFDSEKAHKLVMECYQSGLTAKQWLNQNNINPSTFYNWVKKLRVQPSYDLTLPCSGKKSVPVPYKQDVVQVGVIPDKAEASVVYASQATHGERLIHTHADYAHASPAVITIQVADANILVNGYADQQVLTNVLRSVKAALC